MMSTKLFKQPMVVFLSLLITLPNETISNTLRFSPQRVVIAERQHTAQLTLTNASQKPASYRIELVDVLYQPDGSVVTEPSELPVDYPTAKPFLRFSPSQVRLGPFETQAIRVLVRARNLDDGEYRAHAKFTQLPDLSAKTPNIQQDDVLSGSIGVNPAIVIPVILRRGDTSAKGHIEAMTPRQQKNNLILDIQLARSGNRSLYTDLVVRAPDGTEAAIVKGIALPVPNATRQYAFNLGDMTLDRLKTGGYALELLDREAGGVVLDRKPLDTLN